MQVVFIISVFAIMNIHVSTDKNIVFWKVSDKGR